MWRERILVTTIDKASSIIEQLKLKMITFANFIARFSAVSLLAATTPALAPASGLRLFSTPQRQRGDDRRFAPPAPLRAARSSPAELATTPKHITGVKRCASPPAGDVEMAERQNSPRAFCVVSPPNAVQPNQQNKRVCRAGVGNRPSLSRAGVPSPSFLDEREDAQQQTENDLELVIAALAGMAGGASRPADVGTHAGDGAAGGRDTPTLVVPRPVVATASSALEEMGAGMAEPPAGMFRVLNRAGEVEFQPIPGAPRGDRRK